MRARPGTGGVTTCVRYSTVQQLVRLARLCSVSAIQWPRAPRYTDMSTVAIIRTLADDGCPVFENGSFREGLPDLVRWLWQSLLQARASTVFEAWDEAMPTLFTACMVDGSHHERAVLLGLLGRASWHASLSVRRLALCTTLELSALDTGSQVEPMCAFVALITCAAFSAVDQGAAQPQHRTTTACRATRKRGSVPLIAGEEEIWEATASALMRILERAPSASSRLSLMSVILNALLCSGNLLLALAHGRDLDAGLTKSISAAGAATTGLSPIPLPLCKLIVTVVDMLPPWPQTSLGGTLGGIRVDAGSDAACAETLILIGSILSQLTVLRPRLPQHSNTPSHDSGAVASAVLSRWCDAVLRLLCVIVTPLGAEAVKPTELWTQLAVQCVSVPLEPTISFARWVAGELESHDDLPRIQEQARWMRLAALRLAEIPGGDLGGLPSTQANMDGTRLGLALVVFVASKNIQVSPESLSLPGAVGALQALCILKRSLPDSCLSPELVSLAADASRQIMKAIDSYKDEPRTAKLLADGLLYLSRCQSYAVSNLEVLWDHLRRAHGDRHAPLAALLHACRVHGQHEAAEPTAALVDAALATLDWGNLSVLFQSCPVDSPKYLTDALRVCGTIRAASPAALADSTEGALAEATRTGSPIDAWNVPLRHVCSCLSWSMQVIARNRPAILSAGDAAQLFDALSSVVQAAVSVSRGSSLSYAINHVSTMLFDVGTWAPDALLCDTVMMVLDSVAPDWGLESEGCGPYVAVFAAPFLRMIHRIAAEDWAQDEDSPLATDGDIIVPRLLRLLCRVAVTGEHDTRTSASVATHASYEGLASVRVQAAEALLRVVSRSRSLHLATFAWVLDELAGCSRMKFAGLGTVVATRQMRAWQLAAALSLALPPVDEAAATGVAVTTSMLHSAAAAALCGTVRQYVELTWAGWMAATFREDTSTSSSEPYATAVTACFRDAVLRGQIKPLPLPLDGWTCSASLSVGWSNATVALVALTVALEVRSARRKYRQDTATCALQNGLTRLLLLLCTSCQRRTVREAAQCCLLRVARLQSCTDARARVNGGREETHGSDGGLSSELAMMLQAASAEPELVRMAATQPTLLRPETGDLTAACGGWKPSGITLSNPPHTSILGLVYCVLPYDDNVPPCENAPLKALPTCCEFTHGLLLDALGGVQKRRHLSAASSDPHTQQHQEQGDLEESEDDDPAGSGREAREFRKAQSVLSLLHRALARPAAEALAAMQQRLAAMRGRVFQTKGGVQQRSACMLVSQPAFPVSRGLPSRQPCIPGHLTIIATLLHKSCNVGSILRIAEALGPPGAVTVVVGMPLPALLSDPDVTRAAVGAAKRLNDSGCSLTPSASTRGGLKHVDRKNLSAYLASLFSPGTQRLGVSEEHGVDSSPVETAQVVALELTTGSIPLPSFRFFGVDEEGPPDQTSGRSERRHTVLLLGNEVDGVPASLLEAADVCVEVPQHGCTASLNVAAAAAVALYEYGAQRAATEQAIGPVADAGSGASILT